MRPVLLMLLIVGVVIASLLIANSTVWYPWQRGFLVLTGRCYQAERLAPFYPFLEVLTLALREGSEGMQADIDASIFRRDIRNYADDDLLLNTGVSFPIAFQSAEIRGVEAKLEIPRWGPVLFALLSLGLLGASALDKKRAVRSSG